MAVFRPSTAQWIVFGPSGGHVFGTFGATHFVDIPAPGDYDGVGHTEMAVFRPSTAQWIVFGPSGGHVLITFGATNLFDLPIEAPVGALKKLGLVGHASALSLHQARLATQPVGIVDTGVTTATTSLGSGSLTVTPLSASGRREILRQRIAWAPDLSRDPLARNRSRSLRSEKAWLTALDELVATRDHSLFP
jgi:hypothetical protein